MSKHKDNQATSSAPSVDRQAADAGRRVTVFAIFEDTKEGRPRSWSVVQGTAPAESITVEKHLPEHNAMMTKAHLMRLIDELDLLG